MSVYTMSDIHGCYDEFIEMLDKIAFSDDDELYVLGDIIDRGPKVGEMLVWAVNEAPENVHFLLGNHELMMLPVLRRRPEWMPVRRTDQWSWNTGGRSVRRIKKLTHSAWRKDKLLPWANSLPTHAKVNAGGKDFLLVHAGLNPYGIGCDEVPAPLDDNCLPNGISDEVVDLGDDFGFHWLSDVVWVHSEWLEDTTPLPYDVIHGHSVTSARKVDMMEASSFDFSGGVGRICHYGPGHHDIDCGCARGGGKYRLGCLRLDDFEEFYIEPAT